MEICLSPPAFKPFLGCLISPFLEKYSSAVTLSLISWCLIKSCFKPLTKSMRSNNKKALLKFKRCEWFKDLAEMQNPTQRPLSSNARFLLWSQPVPPIWHWGQEVYKRKGQAKDLSACAAWICFFRNQKAGKQVCFQWRRIILVKLKIFKSHQDLCKLLFF